MFIEAVKIRILSKSGKTFGRYIDFLDDNGSVNEINMVYGENTLGKSMLIESIVYGLNGEAIYGKYQRDIINFQLLLKKFMDEDVEHAEIYLQLKNPNNRVVILRDAFDTSEPVIVFAGAFLRQNDNGKTLNERCTEKDFYKIKKDKNIVGNQTYQEFLFSFLGIEPMRKINNDDEDDSEGERLIFYIQNLMPLFVIPQQGWTDIQANNPKYEIGDIKKTAFEFLLNLSNADVAKYRHSLDHFNSLLRQKVTSLKDLQEVIRLLKHQTLPKVDEELLRARKEVTELQGKINQMEKGDRLTENVLLEIRKKYRHLTMVCKRYEESLSLLESELSQYQFYITKIESDIDKNDKLKTAKKLIGILPIDICPRCLNDISIDENKELSSGHCELCGSELQIATRGIQTLQYLQDELKDFKRIMEKKDEAKGDISSKLFLTRLELKELKQTMNGYEEQLKPKNLEQYNYFSREIGRIENSITELGKDKEVLLKYEKLINEKDRIASRINALKNSIKNAKANEDNDKKKLRDFNEAFKKILFSLDFLKDGFEISKIESLDQSVKEKGAKGEELVTRIYKQITIDLDDYYPKIDGVNLYNITSSSGLIRIILSYYLALLRTSLKYTDATHHPLILVFDEPRQQNLDIDTFNHFIGQLYDIKKQYSKQFQVILASSEKGEIRDEDIKLSLNKVDNKLIRIIYE